MAYDYDVQILAGLWTGAEDAEEPYATFATDNPTLTDDAAENRILSTIEVIRSHMEVLKSRDESRLLSFCLSTMLEDIGSGGFIYGSTSDNENAIVVGNVQNPTFLAADDIEFFSLDGVSAGAQIGDAGPVEVGGTGTLQDLIDAINGDAALAAAGISASRTNDNRLQITQVPVGAATRAAGFVITFGEGGANDAAANKAGIGISSNSQEVEAGLATGRGIYFLAKVIQVANDARDRALKIFASQPRNPDFS